MIQIKGYTQKELDFIVQNYNMMTRKDLANKLNKSISSIGYAVSMLGLVKQKHKTWTDEENNYLIEHYIDMTSEELAKKLNRTIISVNAQRDRLNLVRHAAWSNEEINYLKDNYLSMSHEEIGKHLNRSRGAVTAKCFDLKLFKKDLPWEQWEIDFIRNNYYQMTKREISEALNRSPDAVGLKASRMGLKKYPYYCDYHYFDAINTEEKAYWLGFLIADGWINKNDKTGAGVVGIELQYGDIGHLKKFNKSISGNYQITDRWRAGQFSHNDKKYHECVIRIFSRIMYDSLEYLGFTSDKSLTVGFPNIESVLIRHMVRGYFDGDGRFGLSNNRLSVSFITASKRLNDDLIKILRSQQIEIHEYTTTNKETGTFMYVPEITNNINRIKFLDWIYQDASIYLDRKYYKYLKAKQKYSIT